MSKKPMTWLELIKLKLNEEKAKGNSPSIGDVTPTAKKEWVQIKEGKHPLYVQGKAQTFARKKKTGEQKTRKNSSKGSSSPSASNMDIQALLAEVKLCGKCTKKVEKLMHKKGMAGGKQSGGNCGVGGNYGAMPQTGGQCMGPGVGVPPMTQKGGKRSAKKQAGGTCGCGMKGGCGSCGVL
jgi:hypothetical protein